MRLKIIHLTYEENVNEKKNNRMQLFNFKN